MATRHSCPLLLSSVWGLGAGGRRQEGAALPCVARLLAPRFPHPCRRAEFPVSGSVAPGGQAGLSIQSAGPVVLPAVRWWLCGRPGKWLWCQSWELAPGAPGLAGGAPHGPAWRGTVWGGGDMGWGRPTSYGGRDGAGAAAGVCTCVCDMSVCTHVEVCMGRVCERAVCEHACAQV